MQDKYTLESTEAEFLDQSWDKMRLMLDEQMPHAAPPKPSRPKYELFLLLGLFAWTVYLYWPEPKVEDTAPTKEEQKQTIAQNEKQVAHPTEILSKPSNAPLNSQQKKAINAAVDAKSVASSSSAVQARLLKSDELNNGIIHNESSTAFINNTKNKIKQVQAQPSLQYSTKGIEYSSKNGLTILDPIAAKPNQLTLGASERNPFPLELNATTQTRSLTLGIHAGQLISRSRYSGYKVGVFAELELNRRFSLYSGIELNSIKKINPTESASNAAGDFFELKPSSPLDKNAIGTGMSIFYGTAVDNEEFKVLAVNQMNYLSVPMELVFNINPNFKVNVGMSLSYLMNATMQNDQRPGGWSSAESTIDAASSSKYGQELLGEAINRWDFAPSIGMSLRATRRLSIDFKFRNGIIDISKDDFFGAQDYHSNRYLHLGLGVDLFEKKITTK